MLRLANLLKEGLRLGSRFRKSLHCLIFRKQPDAHKNVRCSELEATESGRVTDRPRKLDTRMTVLKQTLHTKHKSGLDKFLIQRLMQSKDLGVRRELNAGQHNRKPTACSRARRGISGSLNQVKRAWLSQLSPSI